MSEPERQPEDQQSDVSADDADLTSVSAALEDSESDIAKLRADLEEAHDRALRVTAEMENYRKRARREAEDSQRYAAAPLLQDLFPVLDDMFRAIAAAEQSPASDGLLEGVKMIAQGVLGVLARHDCNQIDALHQPFDPTYHEAISQQPSEEYPPNTVLLVVQDGYVLHDRVIRPAQVIVSSAPPA